MSEGVICDVWREGHLDDDQVIRCDQPGHPRVTNHSGVRRKAGENESVGKHLWFSGASKQVLVRAAGIHKMSHPFQT